MKNVMKGKWFMVILFFDYINNLFFKFKFLLYDWENYCIVFGWKKVKLLLIFIWFLL